MYQPSRTGLQGGIHQIPSARILSAGNFGTTMWRHSYPSVQSPEGTENSVQSPEGTENSVQSLEGTENSEYSRMSETPSDDGIDQPDDCFVIGTYATETNDCTLLGTFKSEAEESEVKILACDDPAQTEDKAGSSGGRDPLLVDLTEPMVPGCGDVDDYDEIWVDLLDDCDGDYMGDGDDLQWIGENSDVELLGIHFSRPHVVGEVDLTSVSQEENAHSLIQVQSEQVTVADSLQGAPAEEELEPLETRQVFICRLAGDITEESIIENFRAFGNVLECDIFRASDSYYESFRGFGFVAYETSQMADAAIAGNVSIGQTEVLIKKAHPKPDYTQTNQRRKPLGARKFQKVISKRFPRPPRIQPASEQPLPVKRELKTEPGTSGISPYMKKYIRRLAVKNEMDIKIKRELLEQTASSMRPAVKTENYDENTSSRSS